MTLSKMLWTPDWDKRGFFHEDLKRKSSQDKGVALGPLRCPPQPRFEPDLTTRDRFENSCADTSSIKLNGMEGSAKIGINCQKNKNIGEASL